MRLPQIGRQAWRKGAPDLQIVRITMKQHHWQAFADARNSKLLAILHSIEGSLEH